jgi:hypothetical protein
MTLLAHLRHSKIADGLPRLRQGLWQRRLEVLPTEGPLASAAAVDDGRADLAVVRSDIAIPKKAAIVFILGCEPTLPEVFLAPGATTLGLTKMRQHKRIVAYGVPK